MRSSPRLRLSAALIALLWILAAASLVAFLFRG